MILIKLKYLLLVAYLIGAISGSVVTAATGSKNQKKPNIILIMADDLSAKDMGIYGNPNVPTPVLDRLAQEGALFKTCWATPICSPSRAQIMTGRYGFRTHWFHNDLRNREPLSSRQLTMGQVFKEAGYSTVIVGKWQLPGTIKEHGFDDHYLWLWGQDLREKLQPQFDGLVEQEGHSLPGRPARYWHPAIIHNGQLIDTDANDYGPDLFVQYINRWMKDHKDEPFFLYFPMCLPHRSWDFELNVNGYLPTPKLNQEGKRVSGKSEPSMEANAVYVDYLMGKIISQLDQLKIRDNTVFVFTTDNGTQEWGKSQTMEERGPRVPLVINGPGVVKKIGERSELVQFADILPTLAELAGTEIPQSNKLDGVSFAPLLQGKPYQERDWIFSYYETKRFLREQRFLLDGDGTLWDCGNQRNEQGYVDVSHSNDPAVLEAKARFAKLLQDLPAPDPQSPEYGYLFRK